MKTSILPATGARVSAIALGTMTFGSPVAFADAVELTRWALENGVNFIDTANMYEGYARYAGSPGGVAERVVGEAVAGIRSGAVIATKLGMKVGDAPEDEGTSAEAIRKQLPASLARLQTDYVDIYYLHKPGPAKELEGTLKELARAKTEGAIRCYGVSNYDTAQLETLLEMAQKLGVDKPAACQPPLSLLKTEALETLLPLCERQGVAVVPYQIYQGGLLTGKYRRGVPLPEGSRGAEKPEWLPQMDDGLYAKLESIEADAKAEKLDMAQYALCWTLRQPAVVSAIVGVKTKEQLSAAMQALDAR